MDEKNTMNRDTLNREMKKQQLRRQIVPPPAAALPEPESSEEELREAHKNAVRRRMVIAIVILVIVAAGAAGFFYWSRYHEYTEYAVSWEADILAGDGEARTESSFTGYVDFGSNIIKYTKDGASYIDSRGKTIWVQTYEMKSPIAAVNGDYAVIADQQGNSIYICNEEGCQGVATTLLPIVKVTVSAQGVAGAILEDANSNYITWFRRDGQQLDITIKSRLSGDGYPLDFSFSPDGNKVICSYVYLNNGMMDSRVVFYDFSEIGKNTSPKRLVGGFDDIFSGTIVPRVRFLTDIYSFACSDQGLTFFSSENLASPEVLAQTVAEGEICSLFYSSEHVGIIVANSEGENPYHMEIYSPAGKLLLRRDFDFQYKEVSFGGDQIFLWNEDTLQIYNLAGTLKFSGTFDSTISKVTRGRFPNTYIITDPQRMREITLQR